MSKIIYLTNPKYKIYDTKNAADLENLKERVKGHCCLEYWNFINDSIEDDSLVFPHVKYGTNEFKVDVFNDLESFLKIAHRKCVICPEQD